ncbi:MAG TPA: hypothetical protein VHY21_02890 [Pseudonocardiaceae bacterium]|nr:hypothetical protein [Pseudonocardiaceae bacterium]
MTGGIATRVQITVPFIWLGMALAISFLETPLRFRAPGLTVPLGLGIGRLVFRALNAVELALAVVLTAAMLADHAGVSGRVAPGALWAVLVGQVAVLRPRLDRRARRILTGQITPRSHLHLAYIALEAAKVVLLTVLGGLLDMRVAA